MPTNNRIYIAPSHTKKIFGNMRMVGEGFSGRETPLFQTMMIQDQAQMGESSANPTDPHHTPTFIQPSTSQPQKKQKLRKPKRKDTQIPQSSGPTEHVADKAVYKELDNSVVRAATTASSLEAKQDSGNIAKTQSKATPNESSSLGTTSGGGPRRQKTIGDTISQTRFENVSKHSNDPLLARVLDLERTKTTQAKEIVSLTRRVKKLEQKRGQELMGLKGYTKHYPVNDQDDADMFDVNTLTGDEVLAEQEVATKDVNLTVDEVTLAQALVALKSVKSKVKGDVIEEPSVPVHRIQAEFDEDERLVREKDEANVALTEEWDDIQAKVDADYQLAQRLQAEEQEQFTTEQKATLFKELLEQRRKHFAAKRAEEKRNKPPTKTQ
ncbi:hypothetical protein Tco_1056853 [Tanacetum coccineum]|uniref:Uncharacterized protein n=1 Tax=Tanacetum coccineum TaxID=301880 RepID=A0ABQ5H4Q4_9ASTR